MGTNWDEVYLHCLRKQPQVVVQVAVSSNSPSNSPGLLVVTCMDLSGNELVRLALQSPLQPSQFHYKLAAELSVNPSLLQMILPNGEELCTRDSVDILPLLLHE